MNSIDEETANRIRDARSSIRIAASQLGEVLDTLTFADGMASKALGDADVFAVAPATSNETPAETAPPVCAVHQQPMVWMRTKKGSFWSCHLRNADGSFCQYRP